MNTHPIESCSVCLSPDYRKFFEVDGFPIARCRSCSHVFVAVEVPEEALVTAYGAEYYGGKNRAESSTSQGYTDYLGDSKGRMVVFGDRLRTVSRYTSASRQLLDYGCAVGLFVKVATESGWHAVGYERSAWAVSYGQEQLGLDIRLAESVKEPFERDSFDAVTLWDVAEHLAHPREVLSQVYRWLKPNGILALNTVNISSLGARLAGPEWRHLAPPWHLQYFTRRSLTRLLNELGFEVVGAFGEGAVVDCRKDPIPFGGAFLERAMQHWRIRRLASALNLFDEMMLVAKKRRPS